MCGVFGWVTARPLNSDAPLDRALEALKHRGPDGEGRWRRVSPGGREVALASRRLAILDAAGGAQPMTSHDGRYVLVFNGEVYNHVELRRQLRTRGCRFVGRSDTEVVIEAWRTWGEGCLTRLRGMFAFALHDTQTGAVWLARDPVGKKPLFLVDIPGGVAFASEIEALLDFPGVDGGLNAEPLADYLFHRYVPGPGTFFRGVRKLPPATLLTLMPGSAPTERLYVADEPPARRPVARSAAEAEHAFAEALEEAVRLRLRMDGPCGLFLSGGLDSAVIAALAAREAGAPLKSFTAACPGSDLDESAAARALAQMLGGAHEAVEVGPESFDALWPLAARRRGAPLAEASDIPMLMLAQAAAGETRVVLTGEGADELLGGYPKHKAERWIGAYHALTPRAAHARLIAPLLARAGERPSRTGVLARAALERDPVRRAGSWFASAPAEEIARLAGREPGVVAAGDPAASGFRRLQALDRRCWLPDNLLERGDRMTMAAGIEARTPFMDSRLAALAAELPDRWLLDGRGGKRILRRIARPLLGTAVPRRGKIGFRFPIDAWFRGPLKGRIDDLLRAGDSRTRRLVDPGAMDAVLDGPGERPGGGGLLWTLANLEVFLRAYDLRP